MEQRLGSGTAGPVTMAFQIAPSSYRTSSEWASGVFDLQRIETGAGVVCHTAVAGHQSQSGIGRLWCGGPLCGGPVGVMLMFQGGHRRGCIQRATRQ